MPSSTHPNSLSGSNIRSVLGRPKFPRRPRDGHRRPLGRALQRGRQEPLGRGNGLKVKLRVEVSMQLPKKGIFPPNLCPLRFQDFSKKLVATARGDRAPEMYWELKNKKLASGDDISAIVVGLQVSVTFANRRAAMDERHYLITSCCCLSSLLCSYWARWTEHKQGVTLTQCNPSV